MYFDQTWYIIPSPMKLRRDIVTLPCFRNILVNTRINILQWILTKLGTYLVLKRIWNPIDFQVQRSPGQIFRRGDMPCFALPWLFIIIHDYLPIVFFVFLRLLYCWYWQCNFQSFFNSVSDGKYFSTVRALNDVKYGGPLALTVCHSTPLNVDNSRPEISDIFGIEYFEDQPLLKVSHVSG